MERLDARTAMDGLYDAESIRDALRWLLKQGGYSQRAFAQALSRSPAYVSRMLAGELAFAGELAPAAAAFFDLDVDAAAYLRALAVSDSPSERASDAVGSGAAGRRRYHRAMQEAGHQEAMRDILSHWYVAAVYELLRCEGSRCDPEWVAATLVPSVSVEQASQAIHTLRTLRMVKEDASRQLIQNDRSAWTPVQIEEAELTRIAKASHRSTLGLASASMDRFLPNERFVASFTIGVTEEVYEGLLRRMNEVMFELMDQSERPLVDGERPNRVCHFGVHLFPMSLYTDTEAGEE